MRDFLQGSPGPKGGGGPKGFKGGKVSKFVRIATHRTVCVPNIIGTDWTARATITKRAEREESEGTSTMVLGVLCILSYSSLGTPRTNWTYWATRRPRKSSK